MIWHTLDRIERLRHFLIVVALMFIACMPFLLLDQAHAVSYTWDGGGTTNNWSDCANWSSDTCPGAGDTVTFNSTSTKSSVVDASFTGTITTININSGYTGTISLSRSLTVSTTFSQAAGTFSAGSQSLTLAALTLSGGSFTASSGTTSVSGALTVSGSPTFNANSGTVNFNGSANATLSCNNVSFNLVTFNNTANTDTVSSNCSMPLGSNPTLGNGGGISLAGTLSGSNTLTKSTGALTLGNGSSLTGFSGLTDNGSLTVNGTYNFGSYSTFSVVSTFTLGAAGSITMPSATASFANSFTITSGSTFHANSGTVNFNGSANATLACNNVSFNLVTFTLTGGNKTVNSDCSMPLGSNPTVGSSGGTVTLNGTLSGSGTFNRESTGTLVLNSGGSLSGFTGFTAGAVTINGSYNFGSYSTFVISGGAFTLSTGGTFTAPSGTASFSNNFTISSGSTFNANGGTINFNSTSAGGIVCNGATFNLVTFTHTTNTKTVNSNCTLPLGNNPTISGSISLAGTLSGSGTLAATSFSLNPTGSFSGFSGLTTTGFFVVNNGTYNFSTYTTFSIGGTTTVSAGSLTLPTGGATFNNNLTVSSGASFTASSGTTTMVASITLDPASTFNANGGTINFTGTAGAILACGSKTFNLVTINRTGANGLTINSDCNLPLGSNPTVTSGTTTLNGTLSGSGTLTKPTNSLTLASGSSLSGFSGLNVSSTSLTIGGTYNFSGYTTFNVDSGFTLSAGASFTAPSGTATVGGGLTLDPASTFNANGGTFNFDGTGGNNFSCGNKTFNLVTFTNTAGTKTIGSDCSLPLGNNPNANSGGSITNKGTLSGSGTFTTSGTFTDGTGGVLSGFSAQVANNLTVNATVSYASFAALTVNGDFLQSGGNFTASAGTTSIAGNFTISSGSFTANGGTLEFITSGSGNPKTLACSGKTFNLVVFNTSTTKTVNSDCSLPLGSNPTLAGGGSITLNGTLSGSGTLTTGGTFTLSGSLSGFSGLSAASLSIHHTQNLGSYTPLSVSQDFILASDGAFTAPSGTMTIAGAFTNNGGTFNANGGVVDFNGSDATLNCGSITFNRVNFTNTDGYKTVDSNCVMPVGDNPTLGDGGNIDLFGTLSGSGLLTTSAELDLENHSDLSGFSGLVVNGFFYIDNTVDFSDMSVKTNGEFFLDSHADVTAPSGTMPVSGDFTNQGGIFNANGGTVLLDGTNQDISGNTTFYNLTKAVTSADSLSFADGSTTTVDGKLTLEGGDSSNLLSLASYTNGTPWYLDAEGITDVSFVDVFDSRSIGKTISTCFSIDDGNNSGWVFSPASCFPDNGTTATSLLASFAMAQAFILAQAQNAAQNAFGGAAAHRASLGGTGVLPSRIFNFVNQFPEGKAFAAALAQFFKATSAGLVIGLFIGLLLLMYRRHRLKLRKKWEAKLLKESVPERTVKPTLTPQPEAPARPVPSDAGQADPARNVQPKSKGRTTK